jgi:hypothetical protein
MFERGFRPFSDSLLAVALLLSLGLVFLDRLLSDSTNQQTFYFQLPNMGNVVFPFLLSSMFFAVYAHSRSAIGLALRNKRVRLLSAAAGVGYAVFYILATRTVSLFYSYSGPGSGLVERGYLVGTLIYGPMVAWPGVIFYSPFMGALGYFTVGNVMLIASLGVLAAFASALLIQGAAVKNRNATGAFAGTFVISLFTNGSCCASAAMLPVVGALVGAGAESSLVLYLLPGGPFYDLLIIGNLALLAAGIMISTRRVRRTDAR